MGSAQDTSQPLVSVIVAAYQQPDYLNQALRCIEQQTYRPIEIIVVDDASGEEFTSRYQLPPSAQLIVHEQRRAAAAATRNTGIRAARGKYIALLDQDDAWRPEKLALQAELMESRPDAVLTYCHYERVNTELNPTGELRTCRPLYDDPLRQFLRGNRMVTPSQALLRRQSLEKIGLFDETIRGTADWDMWLRCCGAGAVISDPRVMTLYRQHGAQWSRNRMMIRLGEVQVLEKTASWALPLRPDLRRPLAKSLSRALRLLALEQLANATGRRESAATLLRAIRMRWCDWRNYIAVGHVLRGRYQSV